MSKPQPLYIREDNNTITPIKSVLGTTDTPDCYPVPTEISRCVIGVSDRPDCIGIESTVANLRPELVISRKEYNEQLRLKSRAKYDSEFKPVVDAFKTKEGKLTHGDLSQIMNISEDKAKTKLERLYRADFVGIEGTTYTMTNENMEDIRKVFGVE